MCLSTLKEFSLSRLSKTLTQDVLPLSLSNPFAHLKIHKSTMVFLVFILLPKDWEKVCFCLVCVGLMMNEVSQG